jgi:parallel beta-helix repeat protein
MPPRSRLLIVATISFATFGAMAFSVPASPAAAVLHRIWSGISSGGLAPWQVADDAASSSQHTPPRPPKPTPTPAPTSVPEPSGNPTPTSSLTSTTTHAPTPTSTTTHAPTSTSITTPAPPPISGCSGSPLTSQSQVQPNTSYCGGHATQQISLADGDSWTNGEVSGVNVGSAWQSHALSCGNNCTLVNMYVHDNVGGDGIGAPDGTTNIHITGGRVTNNSVLGIAGGTASYLTIDGVEIDHNGATADCGNEGGGFKGVNAHMIFRNSYVHDNFCIGIWEDINAANNEIAFNRVVNNTHEGIFYEISTSARIHDNTVTGNGFQTNGSTCAWLWGGGITLASSENVEVDHNTVTNNCNGITGTQQNRPDGTPGLLENLNIHDNTVSGPGSTGVVADNGANLALRNIQFVANSFLSGASFCGLRC